MIFQLLAFLVVQPSNISAWILSRQKQMKITPWFLGLCSLIFACHVMDPSEAVKWQPVSPRAQTDFEAVLLTACHKPTLQSRWVYSMQKKKKLLAMMIFTGSDIFLKNRNAQGCRLPSQPALFGVIFCVASTEHQSNIQFLPFNMFFELFKVFWCWLEFVTKSSSFYPKISKRLWFFPSPFLFLSLP